MPEFPTGSPDERVQAFLFRAAATDGWVEDMVERGELERASAATATANGLTDDFSFAIRLEARRMAAVYELLFCFENWLAGKRTSATSARRS